MLLLLKAALLLLKAAQRVLLAWLGDLALLRLGNRLLLCVRCVLEIARRWCVAEAARTDDLDRTGHDGRHDGLL